VLVLCDLLGGTPFNVASAIARRSPRVVCLSGANLAMAVEAALADGDLDDALVERLLEVGPERHRRDGAPPRPTRLLTRPASSPMSLRLVRIDDRLIHGQVVAGWLRALGAQRIVIVDDATPATSSCGRC
jgi:hypothetical protein